MRGYINQRCDLRVRACFSDNGAAVAMGDENRWTVLLIQHPSGSSDIFLQGGERFLNQGDAIPVTNQNVLDGLPA